MIDHTYQLTSTWVFEYVTGFDTFMWKFYPAQYAKAHLEYFTASKDWRQNRHQEIAETFRK